MNSALLRKALMDLRGHVIGWGLGIGGLLALTLALYPSIGAAYGDVIDQMPEEMLAFFGAGASFDTVEGYLSLEFFSYAPLIISIFAIMAGNAGRGAVNKSVLTYVRRQSRCIYSPTGSPYGPSFTILFAYL